MTPRWDERLTPWQWTQRALAAACAFMLLVLVWDATRSLRRHRAPTVSAEGVEILGGPVNLRAEGDTLTICGVARMSDGSYQLGHLALFLRADSDSTVVGYPKGMDVRERCAPLLRKRGLPLDLPLTVIDWRQTEGISVQPEAVT